MAIHKVEAEIKIPALTKADSTFSISADGELLGKLKISKGGIEYVPNKRSKNTVRLNWSKFHDLMVEQLE